MILVKLNLKNNWRSVIFIFIIIYLAFYSLIVVSTGGLASTRYIFPVSLALLVTQLITLFDQIKVPNSATFKRFTMITRAVWVVTVLASLVSARIIVGPGVIDNRLKMYEPTKKMQLIIDNVQSIANIANGSKGATLVVSTGYERFILRAYP